MTEGVLKASNIRMSATITIRSSIYQWKVNNISRKAFKSREAGNNRDYRDSKSNMWGCRGKMAEARMLITAGFDNSSIVSNHQSWAHRSYILSERSKAMSDLWFSEWKKMSVERWANCHTKEFAHRSKRSLNVKERAFLAVRSLSDVTMLSFWGAVCGKNTCDLGKSAA